MNAVRPADAALVLVQTMRAIGVQPGANAVSTATIVLAAAIMEATGGEPEKTAALIGLSKQTMFYLTEAMREKTP